MKAKDSELTQKYLVLVKLDSQNLLNRISSRQDEYIETFSLKRNRSIFKEIFENRYSKASFTDLAFLPLEVIEVANSFYTLVDELYWYLMNTQDMPNTIQDLIMRKVARLSKACDNLSIYIDASLSGDELASENELEDIEFMTLGELDFEEGKNDYIQEETFKDFEE